MRGTGYEIKWNEESQCGLFFSTGWSSRVRYRLGREAKGQKNLTEKGRAAARVGVP